MVTTVSSLLTIHFWVWSVQEHGYMQGMTLHQCLEDLDTNLDGSISFNEYIDWNIRTKVGAAPVASGFGLASV